MKHTFIFLSLLILTLISCQSQQEIAPKYPIKTLLHQKNWRVVSIRAENKSNGETQDWYAQLPSCIKDNFFTTEAPGKGTVGEMHGEEGNTLCQENDLIYQPHIAGWKLNDQQDIFSVSLFASGHSMLYGYEMEESYNFENWLIEVLDEETLQVQVSKTRDETDYSVTIKFMALS